MAGGLSTRRLRLKVDADHNFPSSVHKVLSNDDLLMEILLRLPVLELHLFKRVCKQWLSLIISPSFTSTRTRIPSDPPSGLFIRHWSSYTNEYRSGFVSFDPRIPTKWSIEQLLRGGQIKQSCNGLLLCCIGDNKYYVCNPSNSMFKMLPPIHDLNYIGNGYEEINFAFDPTKSPCYKVVHVGDVEDGEDDVNDYETHCSIRIQTYSSATGVWSVSDDRFPYLWFYGFGDGIYWNGDIHWLSHLEPFHVIKLSIVDHPVLTKMQTPLPLVKGQVHSDRKLYKSDHGSLLLLCKDRDRSRHLKIYEMENGYSVWSLKYLVNLDVMMRPYPTWRMPSDWSCRNMLSIVLGERDEDSFMVIEHTGNILQYKFVIETVSQNECFEYIASECFEYIASFSPA